MESREAMIRRIESFELDSVPSGDTFDLNPALSEKVRPVTGELEPFFGSTTAYYLDSSALALVDHVTNVLHEQHGEALAERLPLNQSHVTLHDLRASTRLDDVATDIFRDGPAALSALRKASGAGPVLLECVAVFNLVSMSIAIGLQPASDDDHERLMRARGLFDAIVPSSVFTPHITLAYYRPEPQRPVDLDRLRVDLRDLTETMRGRLVTLEPERLHLLRFDTMANYWPVDVV